MTPETILTLVASPVLGGAAAKLWQWWAARDAAKLAAEAAEAKVRHDRAGAGTVTAVLSTIVYTVLQ